MSKTARERELEEEVERLRIANRRLQSAGEALERDKLIVQLRERITHLEVENDKLRWSAGEEIETIAPVRISQKKKDVCDWCKMGVEHMHSEDTK